MAGRRPPDSAPRRKLTLRWRCIYSDGSWWTLSANGIFQGRVFSSLQGYYAGWFDARRSGNGWMDQTFPTMRAAAKHLITIARARHLEAASEPQKKTPLSRRRR